MIGAFGIFVAGSLAALALSETSLFASDEELLELVEHDIIVLPLLLGFLMLRGWTLGELGLRFRTTDIPIGLGLALVDTAIALLLEPVTGALWPTATAAAELDVQRSSLTWLPILLISIANPLYEEIFVCGYTMTVLGRRYGIAAAIGASISIRLAYHLYQGILAVPSIVPFGLICSFWFARTGRLWPVIIMHMIADVVALSDYVH